MSNTTEVLKPEKKTSYKKRFGDRKDGRRIRTLDPITNVAPFIMPTRAAQSYAV